MQEQMLGGKGFLVIGYLLEKVCLEGFFAFVLSISTDIVVFSVISSKDWWNRMYLWYKIFFICNAYKLSTGVFSSPLSS